MIRIGQKVAAADDPIEHLVSCHRRIEERLDTLIRAGELLDGRPTETEARAAIEGAFKFLESNGALHTIDEEESLFPRLRPHLSPDELSYLARLEAQHVEADAIRARLKASLALNPDEFRSLAVRLSELYRDHMHSEEELLIDLARRKLRSADLTAISFEMRARR